MLAQIELMGELGLVPFLHSVAESPEETLWRVHEWRGPSPTSPIVVLDAFSSHEQSSHAMHVAELAPNLIFDTSLAYSIEPGLAAHRTLRPSAGDLRDRPLLASAGLSHSWVLQQFLESGLEPKVLADVLAGTAERILGSDS